MKGCRRELGRLGEDAACSALIGRGYEIVERNWRRARGEIDVVARDGTTWVFVEVKARRQRGPERALDTMRPTKLLRLSELGQQYLKEQGLEAVSWRIDWVGVEVDARRQVCRLDLVTGIGADV